MTRPFEISVAAVPPGFRPGQMLMIESTGEIVRLVNIDHAKRTFYVERASRIQRLRAAWGRVWRRR